LICHIPRLVVGDVRARGDEDEPRQGEEWQRVVEREVVDAEERVDLLNVGQHQRPRLPGSVV